jgi:hypothetical protein
MLGASMLVGDDDSLMFAIKGCRAGNKIRVILDPSDTYTVELWKVRGLDFSVAGSVSHIYADQLRDAIASLTGLAVRL